MGQSSSMPCFQISILDLATILKRHHCSEAIDIRNIKVLGCNYFFNSYNQILNERTINFHRTTGNVAQHIVLGQLAASDLVQLPSDYYESLRRLQFSKCNSS